MKFTRDYEADGRGLLTVCQTVERIRQIVEELAAFCEGDVSHNRLQRVAIDLSVGLLSFDDDVTPEYSGLCHEPFEEDGEEMVRLPLERSEHGTGCDLADVLELLESFVRQLGRFSGPAAIVNLSGPAEVKVGLTMVTADPRLAGKLGFAPAKKAA